MALIVQARKALSIDTKHYSKRTEKNKPAQGQWHFEKYDHNYIVTVENNRDEMLKDVELFIRTKKQNLLWLFPF